MFINSELPHFIKSEDLGQHLIKRTLNRTIYMEFTAFKS